MSATSNSVPESWNGYRIERVNASHYEAIAALLKIASQARFDTDYLRKKYATHFLGGINVGYIAFDGNLAISLQMGVLIPLCYQDKTYLSLQACDAATHPNYRKKNLWATLNMYMIQQAMRENIVGIIGLPNQNSYHLYVNKLAYKAAGIFKSYTIHIHRIPFWRIADKLKCGKWFVNHAEGKLKKYQIQPVSFSSFDENKCLTLHRSQEFLAYKTQKGSFFIKLYDTLFWVKFRLGSLFIGDIKTPSESDFDKAIELLTSICYDAGLKNITFQSQSGSFEESLFAKKYKPLDTTPMVYMSFERGAPYDLLKCTYADLDTF